MTRAYIVAVDVDGAGLETVDNTVGALDAAWVKKDKREGSVFNMAQMIAGTKSTCIGLCVERQ